MKRSFKKRYLLLIPISLIMFLAGYFAHLAYSDPYKKIEIPKDQIPVFTEIKLPHEHQYNKKNSIPVLGSAIIDINRDGVEELFLGGGFKQKDGIYKYTENGFILAGKDYGLTKMTDEASYGAAVLDSNNDGWDDLWVARDDGLYLYTNDKGQLSESKIKIKLDEKSVPISLAFGDINGDGLADLFVSAYLKKEFIEGLNIFNKDGYGGQSLLFLNTGNNTFKDITDEAGMRYIHNTFQASFVDLDYDSDLDLVVVHDTGHVKTWRNNGNLTFSDMPNPTSNSYAYPMGLAMGDYDNDGFIDMAFSNVGPMGPMTFKVKGDLREDQVYNEKIIVLRNEGDFTFTDTAKDIKLADYEFGWGLIFEDFNNDALEDLVMAQNFVSLPPHKMFKNPGRFTLQTKQEHQFTSVEKEAGVVNRHFGITPIAADFNGDGQRDFVYVNISGTSRAFINKGTKNNYLGVKLPNRAKSIGALVTVKANGQTFKKVFTTSEGLASDGSHHLLFGLGEAQSVSQVKIKFMNGTIKQIVEPTINSYIAPLN